MEFGKEVVCDYLERNKIPKLENWKLDLSGAIDGMMDFNTKLDEIARDIRDKKDNAMAMEFVKVIGGMLVENGVSLKIEECRDEKIEMNMAKNKIEVKYNVRIDGLDFSEHDKPFEDRIKLLKKRIEEMESEKKFLRMRCMEDAIDAFDRGSYGALTIVGRRCEQEKEIDDLKGKIAKLEEEVHRLREERREIRKRCASDGELHLFDLKRYGRLRIVAKDVMAEDKELKQHIAKLESEKTDLKQSLNEMEKMKSHWIDRAVEWQQKCENLESEKSENCEEEPISDDVRPSSEWYENRYQQDCITINRLNTTIDVLIHKIEYLRQFAGLE